MGKLQPTILAFNMLLEFGGELVNVDLQLKVCNGLGFDVQTAQSLIGTQMGPSATTETLDPD